MTVEEQDRRRDEQYEDILDSYTARSLKAVAELKTAEAGLAPYADHLIARLERFRRAGACALVGHLRDRNSAEAESALYDNMYACNSPLDLDSIVRMRQHLIAHHVIGPHAAAHLAHAALSLPRILRPPSQPTDTSPSPTPQADNPTANAAAAAAAAAAGITSAGTHGNDKSAGKQPSTTAVVDNGSASDQRHGVKRETDANARAGGESGGAGAGEAEVRVDARALAELSGRIRFESEALMQLALPSPDSRVMIGAEPVVAGNQAHAADGRSRKGNGKGAGAARRREKQKHSKHKAKRVDFASSASPDRQASATDKDSGDEDEEEGPEDNVGPRNKRHGGKRVEGQEKGGVADGGQAPLTARDWVWVMLRMPDGGMRLVLVELGALREDHPCAVCRKPCSMQCQDCRVAFYCSATCQSAAWSAHQIVCTPSLRAAGQELRDILSREFRPLVISLSAIDQQARPPPPTKLDKSST
jgi:hypothetical protein